MATAQAQIRSEDFLGRFLALHPKLIDLSLSRIERLLSALGNPERSLAPVIHVAGTNGKGSTSAFLRAFLEAGGKRVQVYSSPHLVDFHERIRLTGGPIREDALIDVLRECEDANGGEPITYFEITTAAALLAFSRDAADFCILEVGLGGRYDATNVISRPAACVITPVAKDHESFLGNRLSGIAREKAGIIKPGVPVISARQSPVAARVIAQQAAACAAPLSRSGFHWRLRRGRDGFSYRDKHGALFLPYPRLKGAHQVDNAALALAALRTVGVSLGEDAVARGLSQVEWPARLQRLAHGPLVAAAGTRPLWLDGGHNPHAAKAIAQFFGGQRLHLVVGMMAGKDVAGFLKPLAPHVTSLAAVPIPGEACYAPQDIVDSAHALGLKAAAYPDLRAAVAAAPAKADVLLIVGSLYLAGQILGEIGPRQAE